MTITKLEIDNANPAHSYSFVGSSGSASSIQISGAVANTSNFDPLPTVPASPPAPDVVSVNPPSTAIDQAATTLYVVPAATGQGTDPTPNHFGGSVTTINLGPTADTLQIALSGASKLSWTGIATFVFGAAIILLVH